MRKLMEKVNGLSADDFLTEALTTCPDCNGAGVIDGADASDPADDEWCNTCNGKGEVYSKGGKSFAKEEVVREYSEDENLAEELEEVQEQMLELLDQAERIVSGTNEYDSARGYWLAHIKTALSNDHDYLGGSMSTMQDTIDALREGDEDEDYDDEDDDPNNDPSPRGADHPEGESYFR